jgi:hypothetical protein
VWIIIVLFIIVTIAVITGNQIVLIKKTEQIQKTLEEINRKM